MEAYKSTLGLLTYSLTYFLTYSLTNSLTNSLTCSLSYSPTYSLSYSLTDMSYSKTMASKNVSLVTFSPKMRWKYRSKWPISM